MNENNRMVHIYLREKNANKEVKNKEERISLLNK